MTTPVLNEATVERMCRAHHEVTHPPGNPTAGTWGQISAYPTLKASRIAAMRAAIEASGLVDALTALMAEVARNDSRAPYPIWAGPEQAQRVSIALIVANGLLSHGEAG